MGIVILYAAADFLMPKKKNTDFDIKQKREELNTFVATLSEEMSKAAPKSMVSLVFNRAEQEWDHDPFLDKKTLGAWSKSREKIKEDVKEDNIEFVYSGYIEVDRKRIAIINGMEYREGEALDIKGYLLKKVFTSSVVIENRGTGTTVNVPLLE